VSVAVRQIVSSSFVKTLAIPINSPAHDVIWRQIGHLGTVFLPLHHLVHFSRHPWWNQWPHSALEVLAEPNADQQVAHTVFVPGDALAGKTRLAARALPADFSIMSRLAHSIEPAASSASKRWYFLPPASRQGELTNIPSLDFTPSNFHTQS
jgi:hypothetical protein